MLRRKGHQISCDNKMKVINLQWRDSPFKVKKPGHFFKKSDSCPDKQTGTFKQVTTMNRNLLTSAQFYVTPRLNRQAACMPGRRHIGSENNLL